ncbi:MAG: L-histidine N(alpha)-methyltransferase [Cyclobacteriaceae bacterium]
MTHYQISDFEKEVIMGLSAPNKYLLSKYFYDEEGSRIFQEIMRMEEYYLPSCETEILQEQSAEIINCIPFDQLDFIELGAGDGSKTVFLLESFVKSGKVLNYLPMDISPNILEENKKNIHQVLPDLPIKTIAGDYFHTLEQIKSRTHPKIILFMGSNIGNFKGEKAIEFVKFIHAHLKPGDFFLLGVDLKKHPKTILDAYNDHQGITKRFNLNLLKRINRELDGNFDIPAFDHYCCYDPISGIASSYLVSLKQQKSLVCQREFDFQKDEVIHMETSQKYSLEDLDQLAQKTGFSWDRHFLDQKDYFSVSLFKK